MSPGFMIEREGATVELSCEATGIPAPTLTWLKDGKELGRSARVSASSSPGNRVVIKSVVVADAGVYTCLFKNPVAQLSHDIRLVVKGRSVCRMQCAQYVQATIARLWLVASV